MSRRGQIAIYIYFIVLAIFILLIGAVFAPMGVLFNVKMYEAGEQIMLQANDSISNIQDDAVRTQVQAVIDTGLSDVQTNIEVNSDIFQYSWVLMLGVTGMVAFLLTRRIVEFNQGGLV